MKTIKNLIICGKANAEVPVMKIREQAGGAELWMCGTDTREGADCYYELHDLPTVHEKVVRELPSEVYEFGLPINNTICALLVYAWLSGYKKIKVIGAPMNAKNEYQEQRPALAYIIGWLNSKGLSIEWDVIPYTLNYGKKKDAKRAVEVEDAKKY